MLSVLIETMNDEEGLARTLASLIGGAVEGVVRDVIVCDAGSTDQTHRVAEHAGCHFGTGGIAAAIGQAKGDWLLFLEPEPGSPKAGSTKSSRTPQGRPCRRASRAREPIACRSWPGSFQANAPWPKAWS
jgi:hypothetical protein